MNKRTELIQVLRLSDLESKEQSKRKRKKRKQLDLKKLEEIKIKVETRRYLTMLLVIKRGKVYRIANFEGEEVVKETDLEKLEDINLSYIDSNTTIYYEGLDQEEVNLLNSLIEKYLDIYRKEIIELNINMKEEPTEEESKAIENVLNLIKDKVAYSLRLVVKK